jgi:glycosyltransferase involved in cell wall biosynthesis
VINLLVLTNELNYADGVSSHLFYLLSEIKKKKKLNIFLACSGGDSIGKFKDTEINILEDENLNHHNRSIKNFSKIILRLLKFAVKNNINIIHSHNHYAANAAYRVSRFASLKTVQTIHGLLQDGGRLGHFMAHKYISVSEPVIYYILRNRIAERENVKLIRQGFPVLKNLQLKDTDEVKIICASRLVYEKGVDTFIRASVIVKEKYKGKIKFMIAGTGDEEKKLRELSGEINSEIKFLGNVKDMPGLLLGTNIFVLPSRSMSEGFPMTIVEAAFTKNLIISSRFDWLDYIFESGKDGLTFEINRYKELAAKILYALENPEIVNGMKEEFFNKALKLFDIETMAKKHLELYNECLIQ